MTRPLSSLGAPAEIHRVPEIPSTTHEASASRSPESGSLGKPRVLCGFCGLELYQDLAQDVIFRHPASQICHHSGAMFSLVGWMHLAQVTIGEGFEQWRGIPYIDPLEVSSLSGGVGDHELRTALLCRLIFASRNLAQSNIQTSDYRSVTEGVVPEGNQVCVGCGMHSHCRNLQHTPSCLTGEVLSILDRLLATRDEATTAAPIAEVRR